MPVVAEHYYCRLGAIPLQVSDSIVTVKFNPLVPQPSIETFAATVEGLDESFVPERHDRGFYIFHVDAGYEIDSLIGNLYTKPVVELAFPAFTDTGENAVFELSDLFVISYHNWVTQETMDSIQNYYHVQLEYGPYEITGSRGMLVTRQSGMNTLEIANRLYESGLVEYSQPAMFSRVGQYPRPRWQFPCRSGGLDTLHFC
ncbi:MAG: hypothetical protein AB1690_09130 [Candidatus Zixiibacteriota bacterium]